MNFEDIVANIIASVVVAIPSFVAAIIIFFRSLSLKKFYDALFSALGNPKSEERYRLKHYVKHTFLSDNYQADSQPISYRRLIKTVKKTKVVLLMGSAGIGKSKLMQRLALQYRTRIHKGTDGGSLSNFGVLFYKLTGDETVEAVIARIARDVTGSPNSYSVFLDGLDEMIGLHNSTGDEILRALIRSLSKELASHCKKIFISLRPEILEKRYSYSEIMPDEDIAAFSLRKFDEKQILAMYRNETKSRGEKALHTAAERAGNLKKLKAIVKDKKDSVFKYPLILTWANDLLSDSDLKELQKISWYDAIGKVIEKGLERECVNYCSAHNIAYTQDFRNGFVQNGREFLTEIAFTMACSDTTRIEKESVMNSAAAKHFYESVNETTGYTFTVRRLLCFSEWSNAEGGGAYYEFFHNTVFERVLAECILNHETPQTVRAELVLKQAKNKFTAPMLQFCREGLWSVYGNELFIYQDKKAYFQALAQKKIACRTDARIVPKEIILTCFLGFSEIDFDYSIKFNAVKIEAFVVDRKLDLSYSNTSDLSFLNGFSVGSYDILDCSYTNVTDVIVPDYIQSINFKKCTLLRKVVVPQSVKRIGRWSISRIRNEMKFQNQAERYEYDTNSDFPLKIFKSPNDTKLIGEDAFFGCEALTAVIISNGVESIEDFAFIGCVSLKNIIIPSSVKNIGVGAFSGCKALTEVIIQDGVESILNGAFMKCESLQNITIPGSVKCVEKHAFDSCGALAEVIIEDGVESIGEYAFGKCELLKQIKISSSVKIIGKFAFMRCTSLTHITIPSSVKSVESGTFMECNALTEVIISNGVENIRGYAFAGCTSLQYITIPESLKSIEDMAFAQCSNLIDITILNGVESIEKGAFSQCQSLSHITIPSSVKIIGEGVFVGCHALTEVNITDGLNSIGKHAFLDCSSLTNIIIPSSVMNIGEGAFFGCHALTEVTIQDGVESIEESAFQRCISLPHIIIPRSVKDIGKQALAGCSSLTDVIIQNGVESVGEGAFIECNSLRCITIPSSVKSIGEGVFDGCSSLTEAIIPKGVNSIEARAFLGCSSLQCIGISDSVERIGDYAFQKCSSMTQISIPNSVSSIGKYAFSLCPLLNNIILPKKLTEIKEHVFWKCLSLSYIKIPNGVTSIGVGAFGECKSLTEIVFQGTEEEWKAITKEGSWNEHTGEYTVTCTDGTLTKEESEE